MSEAAPSAASSSGAVAGEPAAAVEKLDRSVAAYAKRWLSLHKNELRALAIGALSLALFLLSWHLLTNTG